MNISSVTSYQSMAEEAMETMSQTKAEAAKGDQQAARKLAAAAAQDNASSAPQPPASTKHVLDVHA